jgi:hypothetical protein
VAAEVDDAVDQVEDLCVDGHHPFGVEFAVGDHQPAAMIGNLVDAVQLEIEQFPDPQPAGSLQPERGGGQRVLGLPGQHLGQATVDVDRQVAGQRLRKLGVVVAEHQPAGWCSGQPHSVMSVRNPVNASTRRDRSATVINSPFFGLTASTSDVG